MTTTKHTPHEVYAQLGARTHAGGTRFSVYASSARACAVRLFDDGLKPLSTRPMDALGDGLFALDVPDAGHGTLYKFVLDGQELPDPYARFLPHGVHGPAMVVEPRHAFRHGPGVARPLSEQVIYELHVGTFTPEGTYRAAMDKLESLAALGITTIELMPVAAFAGTRGWGYDGVALFAPFAPYGTPDELRALVDEAHGHGLSVLLDVVYNHFGPAGNYLSAYSEHYFSNKLRNAWGDAPYFAHPVMRAYVLSNARYWLEEFRFDGLRLDAVHAIVDASSRHVLDELVEQASKLEPKKTLVAEDDQNDPALITRVGLDAVWADDFHHQVRVTLTRESDGYYSCYRPGVPDIARAITQGFLFEGQVYPTTGKARGKPAHGLAAESFVYCIQNHDQVGNRALGDRLTDSVSLDAYCMASTLLLFLPMTPMLFMGQEWAASTPFLYFTDHDPELGQKVSAGRREEFKGFQAFSEPSRRAAIPDPQAVDTFARSKLRHEEQDGAEHGRVLALYRALLALRKHDPVLQAAPRAQLEAEARGDVLWVRRWHEGQARLLLANFGARAVDLSALELPSDRTVLLDSRGEPSARVLAPEHALIMGYATQGAAR
jgi:maltooligosyltrehalose trehalohydrolase